MHGKNMRSPRFRTLTLRLTIFRGLSMALTAPGDTGRLVTVIHWLRNYDNKEQRLQWKGDYIGRNGQRIQRPVPRLQTRYGPGRDAFSPAGRQLSESQISVVPETRLEPLITPAVCVSVVSQLAKSRRSRDLAWPEGPTGLERSSPRARPGRLGACVAVCRIAHPAP